MLLFAAAGKAQADLTAFWQNNPITPQAVSNDPTLANMQSWSVMITNTDGLWSSAGLRAVLPPGNSFYRNLNGGLFRPSVAQQSANPALTFHTYITDPTQSPNSPTAGAPAILGGFPDLGTKVSFGGPSDPIPGTFSVAWGDPMGPSIHPPGTFEIARLTFPISVFPGVDPRSQTSQVNPGQTVLIPTTIPEPCGFGLSASAAAALTRRRRRS